MRVCGNNPHAALIVEDALAQHVPPFIELAAEAGNPFRGRMVGRMGAAWSIVDEPRPLRRDRGVEPDMGDGVVRCCSGQVPARYAEIGMDRRMAPEQIAGLPLARIAADETIEIVEAHAGWPIVEGPGWARFPTWHIVVLAEPSRRIARGLQRRGNRRGLPRDDGVVAWKTGGGFGNSGKAHGMVIAASQQRGAGWRTERRGVELRVAQPSLRHAIQRGCWDNTAEGGWRTKTDIIGQNYKDIRCIGGCCDLWGPSGPAITDIGHDRAGEGWRWRWQAEGVRRHDRIRCAWRAADLLCARIGVYHQRGYEPCEGNKLWQTHGAGFLRAWVLFYATR